MSIAELSLPFGLGLASSLHCAQMCGPIVLSYSLTSGRSLRAHALYNLGRITTYTLLGAVAGALGSVFRLAGRIVGVEQSVALAAGVVMIIAGIITWGLLSNQTLVQIGEKFSVASIFARRIGRLISSQNPLSKFALGFTMGFLPCGLVYAALLRAVAAEGALDGAAAMIAFGSGTFFALFGLGAFSSVIGARLGRWSNQIAAVSIILMGVVLVWHGVRPVAIGPSCHHQ
jgi:sulfite exporter TauE/SafE